jgi:hypothetical protein
MADTKTCEVGGTIWLLSFRYGLAWLQTYVQYGAIFRIQNTDTSEMLSI